MTCLVLSFSPLDLMKIAIKKYIKKCNFCEITPLFLYIKCFGVKDFYTVAFVIR